MRSVLTVQVPAPAGIAPDQIQLRDGDSATFGECRCGRCALDLTLDKGPWFAARITAANGHGLLTNLTPNRVLVVKNMENSYEYFTVEPGRHLAPVPFELSRIGAAADLADAAVTVFGAEPWRTAARVRPCPAAPSQRPDLDPRATYYTVLQALCEPRLRESVDAPLPTSEEIAGALGLTPRAVDAHIEYLSGKLGLPRGGGREVLVAAAIRRRLIPV